MAGYSTATQASPQLAPFRFAPRRGKLHWRAISTLDLDRIQREVRPGSWLGFERHRKSYPARALALATSPSRARCDIDGWLGFSRNRDPCPVRALAWVPTPPPRSQCDIDTLEQHLEDLAYAHISESDLSWLSESGFAQLFRLMQMLVEYLLYVQNALHSRNIELEAQVGGASAQAATVQAQLVEQALYSGVLESRLSGKPVAPGAFSAPPLAHSGAFPSAGAPFGLGSAGSVDGPAQCALCFKLFESSGFLGAHMQRRHPRFAPPGFPHPDAASSYTRDGGAPTSYYGAPASTYGPGAESSSLVDAIAQELVEAMAPLQPGGAGAAPYFLNGPVCVSNKFEPAAFENSGRWSAENSWAGNSCGQAGLSKSFGVSACEPVAEGPAPAGGAIPQGDMPPGWVPQGPASSSQAEATQDNTGGSPSDGAVARAVAEATAAAAGEAQAALAALREEMEGERRSTSAEVAAAREAGALAESRAESMAKDLDSMTKDLDARLRIQAESLRRSLEEVRLSVSLCI